MLRDLTRLLHTLFADTSKHPILAYSEQLQVQVGELCVTFLLLVARQVHHCFTKFGRCLICYDVLCCTFWWEVVAMG